MTCIPELFEKQATRTPDAIAAVCEADSLSYRDLNQRANRLARHLRGLGVGPDVLVALFVERSLDMVVAMLGVLKAGGAYVPLDTGHPRARLAARLADAQPLVLLTQARLQSDLPAHSALVVTIDDDAPETERAAAAERMAGPHDLAYVIYTSGSTGEPKGVAVEHGAVVNMLASMQRRPGLAARDTMLAITTLSFDIAVLEIFLPLVCGARLVVAGPGIAGDGAALASLIAQPGVSAIQATPATLRMLLDVGWRGDPRLKILCGGEAWTADLAGELLPRCGSLWNMYGPTETTVWSAVSRVKAGRPVTIGPPIDNTGFYVLDGARQPVPVGGAGELFIGGEGVARGYWRRPELTQERFMPDPYAQRPGARMYRTGDQVRRLADGSLAFLGRLDDQVKIRGHRIEPGEIEAALAARPGIGRCVVVAREHAPGEKQLVAYIILSAGAVLDVALLRRALGETLPGYMIPAAFVPLAAFPLTLNGKVDRKALPLPDADTQQAGAGAPEPRTPTEQVLWRIWCDMLGRRHVGVHDNFFDLGGHSLLAVRVIGEINKALKARLHVPAFFQNPTIAQLACVLERGDTLGPEAQVVALQAGRDNLPVYFMGARPQEYRLGRLIGGNRAVFAIDVPIPEEWHHAVVARDSAVVPTIEELGALYGDVLWAHAGSTPCIVAGYSLGGNIAFEAAGALQRAGGKAALVLLVDAWAFSYSGATRGPGWQSLRWIWQSLTAGPSGRGADIDGHSAADRLRTGLGSFRHLLRWLLGRVPQVVRNRLRPAPVAHPSAFLDRQGLPIDQRLIDRLIRVMGKTWRPNPLDAAGVLFRANAPGMETLPGYDFANGWGDCFTQGLEIAQSAGDHVSMVDEENIAILASQITAVLDRHEDGLAVALRTPAAVSRVEVGL